MRIFIFFIIFLSLCGISYSLEQSVNPVVETVTLPIKITDLYEDLASFNVKIYDPENIKIAIPVNIYKIDKENYLVVFYLYSNFTYGNYSVLIQNAKIINNNILKERNFIYYYLLLKTNSSLRVDPVVVFLDESNTPFEILVISYGGMSESVDVNMIIQPNTQVLGDNVILASIDSKKLKPSTLHNIEILVKNIKSKYIGKIILDIYEKNYEIFIYSKSYFDLESKKSANNKSLIFLNDKDYINLSLEYGKTVPGGGGEITLKNDGDLRLDRINIILLGNLPEIIRLGNISIAGLEGGNQTSFFIYVNENLSAKQGQYQGNITIAYDTGEINLPVYILVLPNVIDSITVRNETKAENLTDNKENVTDTIQDDKGNKKPLIILISIFLVVFILSFLFIKKGKKKAPTVDNSKFDEIISKYEGK